MFFLFVFSSLFLFFFNESFIKTEKVPPLQHFDIQVKVPSSLQESLSSSHLRLQTGDVRQKTKVSLSSQWREKKQKKNTPLASSFFFLSLVYRVLSLQKCLIYGCMAARKRTGLVLSTAPSFRLLPRRISGAGGSHLTSTRGEGERTTRVTSGIRKCCFLGVFFQGRRLDFLGKWWFNSCFHAI